MTICSQSTPSLVSPLNFVLVHVKLLINQVGCRTLRTIGFSRGRYAGAQFETIILPRSIARLEFVLL